MHFINANQLANALAHASIPGIGPVERITGTEAAHYYPKLFGRTGIIYFQDYWKRTVRQRPRHRRPHRRLERLPLVGQMAARVVLLARLLLELRQRRRNLVLGSEVIGAAARPRRSNALSRCHGVRGHRRGARRRVHRARRSPTGSWRTSPSTAPTTPRTCTCWCSSDANVGGLIVGWLVGWVIAGRGRQPSKPPLEPAAPLAYLGLNGPDR